VASLPKELQEPMKRHFARFKASTDETMDLFRMLHEQHNAKGRVKIQLAPANLHWCSDKALTALSDASAKYNAPIHMHLLETAYQKEYAWRRGKCTALEYIDRFGMVNERLTLGHGVWLGITVGMGLDEAGINEDRDMLQELKLALRVHRTPGMDDDVPTPSQIVRMATEGGALTTAFGAELGRLDPGRFFDAVLIDWDKATYPYQDPDIPMLDALVQRAKSQHVDTVYIDGEVVYRDGKFTKIDRDAVLKEIADILAKPRTPEEVARRELGLAVFPHVRKFYEGYLRDRPRTPFYAPSSST